MIKVIEEKPVPREEIKCSNCNSLLEYGNSDLHVDYSKVYSATRYYFICPVCGCKVDAYWIVNKF